MTQWPPVKTNSRLRLLRIELHDHVCLDRGRNGMPRRQTQKPPLECSGVALQPVGQISTAAALRGSLDDGNVPAVLPYGHHIAGPDLKGRDAYFPPVHRKVTVQDE